MASGAAEGDFGLYALSVTGYKYRPLLTAPGIHAASAAPTLVHII